MNIGNKRKSRLSEFTIKEYGINGVLIAVLFLFGLFLSGELSAFAVLMYLVLWAASYFVLYALTCRNCMNYGKSCPVPLEGSCVQRFFSRGKNFGLLAGAGAVLAYFLRVCIPFAAIFQTSDSPDNDIVRRRVASLRAFRNMMQFYRILIL